MRRHPEWPLMRVAVFVLATCSATLLIGRVVFSNLPPDGRLRTFAVPGSPSPFFGGFRPENRTVITPDGHAELKSEPIYFSMAVPPFFRTATVRMEYRNLGQPVIELGARSSSDAWAFHLKPIEADRDALDGVQVRPGFLDELARTPPAAVTADGWKVSETTFDLGPLAVDADGDLQMVVSLPGMKTITASVLVRAVEIEYGRPPLTLDHVVDAIRKRLTLL